MSPSYSRGAFPSEILYLPPTHGSHFSSLNSDILDSTSFKMWCSDVKSGSIFSLALLIFPLVFADDKNANGVIFLYPSAGLTPKYLDTVNTTWTSMFQTPYLYTSCRNGTGDIVISMSHPLPLEILLSNHHFNRKALSCPNKRLLERGIGLQKYVLVLVQPPPTRLLYTRFRI
jgi:hypothetical protein